MLVSPQWPLTICDLQAEDKLFVQTFCLLTNYYGSGPGRATWQVSVRRITTVREQAATRSPPCNRYQHEGVRRHPSSESLAMSLRLAFKLPEPCHSARQPGYYRFPSRFRPARLRGHGSHGLSAALVTVRESSVTNCQWTNARHSRAMLPRLPSICCQCESELKPLKT